MEVLSLLPSSLACARHGRSCGSSVIPKRGGPSLPSKHHTRHFFHRFPSPPQLLQSPANFVRRPVGSRMMSSVVEATVAEETRNAGDVSSPQKRVLQLLSRAKEKFAVLCFALSRIYCKYEVGCGGAALDFLASVESFPKPDDKIRTTELQVQGGGNVGNALTAAARLGIDCRIFTKVANDGPGAQILAELQGDGVDTSNVVVAEGVSPFTYVIVDKEQNTRTCIHTPGFPGLEPQELTPATITTLLKGADMVYFDGRLVETALLLAEEASKRQLPILVDAERLREGLDEMLGCADYVVASAKFPQLWTAAPTLGEALLTMLLRLPHVKFVIVTLGADGCIMLERHTSETTEGEVLDVNLIVDSLSKQGEQLRHLPPSVVSTKVGWLGAAGKKEIWGRCLLGTAEKIPASELVDTTGAGDGFIGGIMYALLHGLTSENMLKLGTVVAAGSCRALGARSGLPKRTNAMVSALL